LHDILNRHKFPVSGELETILRNSMAGGSNFTSLEFGVKYSGTTEKMAKNLQKNLQKMFGIIAGFTNKEPEEALNEIQDLLFELDKNV